MSEERVARVAENLLDTVAAQTRTADEALRALALATAHICAAMRVDVGEAIERLRNAAGVSAQLTAEAAKEFKWPE
jgi:hypothetical protein